jgi:hypothetical protein
MWERMLEIEFVDRSVALAGKAFVSFFPLVIVVAAFLPSSVRSAIFATLTRRIGLHGEALHTTRQAFAGSDDVRLRRARSASSSPGTPSPPVEEGEPAE